ncbi:hypothetical protein [Vibrio sp. D431a]|uniref:hypothetical protein n=1 Tax=Vibrio sp. D431a TaxID=2837388 RepID=UPI0025529E79|nr:hypothetical protein [Vibrio sp. D431a]MDK9793729.1 hypothetical protein [Vibrio sp. D431a]
MTGQRSLNFELKYAFSLPVETGETKTDTLDMQGKDLSSNETSLKDKVIHIDLPQEDIEGS